MVTKQLDDICRSNASESSLQEVEITMESSPLCSWSEVHGQVLDLDMGKIFFQFSFVYA